MALLNYETVYLHELTDGLVTEWELSVSGSTSITPSVLIRPLMVKHWRKPMATRPVGNWSTGCAGLTNSPQVSPVAVSGMPREATQQQQDMINRVLAT